MTVAAAPMIGVFCCQFTFFYTREHEDAPHGWMCGSHHVLNVLTTSRSLEHSPMRSWSNFFFNIASTDQLRSSVRVAHAPTTRLSFIHFRRPASGESPPPITLASTETLRWSDDQSVLCQCRRLTLSG
eukprot:TRINITY_DN17653_c0_g1_i10.p2 TRINITY_DN17653_c0_g1~~TRINITY_DN17653_c0_g1_i10.p2  ORF type:complete len:128 (+),score=1.06 TRINITY_DN17653_c0_g1_i10:241-624(+)